MANRITAILACALIAASGCTTTVPGSATAGGEIGGGLETTTQPRPVSLEGKQACTIVDETMVAKTGMRNAVPNPARNNWGSLCLYRHKDVDISILLTDGPNQGLAQLQPHEHAAVTTRTIGGFPARQDAIGRTCSLIAELLPGRALRVTYSDPAADTTRRCAQAEALVSEAIARIPN